MSLPYVLGLKGVRYVGWDGKPTLGDRGPFWAANEGPPHPQRLQFEGVCCVGVLNLMLRAKGLPVPGVAQKLSWAGTTDAWFTLLAQQGVLHEYVNGKIYPPGTIVLSPYKDVLNQGHAGVVVEHGQFLHAYRGAGTVIDPSPAHSHRWARYTHVALPAEWMQVIRANLTLDQLSTQG